MKRLAVVPAAGPGFVEELTRAWDAGDAVLPLDPRLPAPARDAVLAAARPDDSVEGGDALVVATSGTGGAPKAVVLTHEAVRASALATSARLGIDASDRWLACLPLSHVGGLSVVTRALLMGTALTVHASFDPAALEAAAREGGCTRTSLVPTALARIDPGLFRTVLVGGQSPPADRPANVIATYGMTETGSGIAYEGVPLDGVELRIDDQHEIHIRAPMLLRCYRDGTDPRDPDGWFATGDLGQLRDGLLRVHGRRGDLIITGGENVWPVTVEHVLALHPAVAEVAVVGRADPEWGQRVVAVVVPADPQQPPTLAALRDAAKAQLPAYAAPTVLELAEALPRTASGKVRRTAL
ncbi:MAG: fatty acid--CoA ligase family protein [Acidimicrobiales bacterium]|nr:fatty acid--CoA ligase family protein [Acidimicrobiales bacterium]